MSFNAPDEPNSNDATRENMEGNDGAAPPATGDFGLPVDLEEISARNSDEFEATGEVTRTVAALDLGPEKPLGFDPASTEFDVNRVGFVASSALFASSEVQPKELASAPPLPFFVRPVRTSFRSAAALETLQEDLEVGFAACSVAFSPSETQPCAYDCSVVRELSVVEFEVRIFSTAEKPRHLVEIRHMRGCRYAFSEASTDLASQLKVAFVGVGACNKSKLLSGPPPFPDALLELPSLKRATSGNAPSDEDSAKLKAAPEDAAAPPPFPLSLGDEEEVCTCAHVMQLLSAEASSAMRCQGCRAAGSLAASLAETMGSCELQGSCGADHRNHHLLFAEGGSWVQIAERVAALAKPPAAGVEEAREEEECRTVAMAAVANISQLRHCCAAWLTEAVQTVVAGAADDQPHVRREALRAAEALASRDKELAAALVRAGVVPTLEFQAEGGDGDQSPDLEAQRFARGALRACRA